MIKIPYVGENEILVMSHGLSETILFMPWISSFHSLGTLNFKARELGRFGVDRRTFHFNGQLPSTLTTRNDPNLGIRWVLTSCEKLGPFESVIAPKKLPSPRDKLQSHETSLTTDWFQACQLIEKKSRRGAPECSRVLLTAKQVTTNAATFPMKEIGHQQGCKGLKEGTRCPANEQYWHRSCQWVNSLGLGTLRYLGGEPSTRQASYPACIWIYGCQKRSVRFRRWECDGRRCQDTWRRLKYPRTAPISSTCHSGCLDLLVVLRRSPIQCQIVLFGDFVKIVSSFLFIQCNGSFD